MPNDALSVIEAKITIKMDEFSSEVLDDNAKKTINTAEEFENLIPGRNNKCKLLK